MQDTVWLPIKGSTAVEQEDAVTDPAGAQCLQSLPNFEEAPPYAGFGEWEQEKVMEHVKMVARLTGDDGVVRWWDYHQPLFSTVSSAADIPRHLLPAWPWSKGEPLATSGVPSKGKYTPKDRAAAGGLKVPSHNIKNFIHHAGWTRSQHAEEEYAQLLEAELSHPQRLEGLHEGDLVVVKKMQGEEGWPEGQDFGLARYCRVADGDGLGDPKAELALVWYVTGGDGVLSKYHQSCANCRSGKWTKNCKTAKHVHLADTDRPADTIVLPTPSSGPVELGHDGVLKRRTLINLAALGYVSWGELPESRSVPKAKGKPSSGKAAKQQQGGSNGNDRGG